MRTRSFVKLHFAFIQHESDVVAILPDEINTIRRFSKHLKKVKSKLLQIKTRFLAFMGAVNRTILQKSTGIDVLLQLINFQKRTFYFERCISGFFRVQFLHVFIRVLFFNEFLDPLSIGNFDLNIFKIGEFPISRCADLLISRSSDSPIPGICDSPDLLISRFTDFLNYRVAILSLPT